MIWGNKRLSDLEQRVSALEQALVRALSQPPASPAADVQPGPAGPGNTPPERPRPYKCSVCHRFGRDVHVNCQYPGCPDGR